MQVKDMFLKNENCIYRILIFILFLLSQKAYSQTNDKIEILDYFNSLKNFSASFLQNDGLDISEGKVYIGEKRIRAEYFFPTKILIILDENKAMYYNYELEEDEFFNPKDTNAWFFYDIFRNPLFFKNALIKIKNKELVLEKNGIINEGEDFTILVYFEKDPLVLRAIEIIIGENSLKLSIYNHSYNEDYDKNFFKLINPKFFN